MDPRSFPRTLLLLTLGATLAAGCQSAPRKNGGAITAVGAPVAAGAAATPTPAPVDGAAVVGVASLPGGPFDGATIKAFKPGSTTAIATGQIGADGTFGLALGKAVPQGAALKLVATRGEKTLATMVAAGAGNLVAAGGGNLVAAGGGNLVAAGGGNMVAAGAGNLVAAGAGNFAPPRFALMASEPGNATMNLGTTVACAALGKRLDGAAAAGLGRDGEVLADVLDAVFSAFDKFAEEAGEALEKDPTLADAVLTSLDENGGGGLAAGLADSLADRNAGLLDAFSDAAGILGDALTAAAEQGVDVGFGTESLSFAGQVFDAITLPDGDEPAPGDKPPAGPPSDPDPVDPLPGAPTTGGGSSGGGSSGGGSSGDGSGGADGDPTVSNGTVTIRGKFTPPSPDQR